MLWVGSSWLSKLWSYFPSVTVCKRDKDMIIKIVVDHLKFKRVGGSCENKTLVVKGYRGCPNGTYNALPQRRKDAVKKTEQNDKKGDYKSKMKR